MTLPSNPNGISTLPDTRGYTPTLAAAATAAKLKKGLEKKNNAAAAASAADAANASGRGSWGVPGAAEPGRAGPKFRLATPATATKFKKWPEKLNNVAVATVAVVATTTDSPDDRRGARAAMGYLAACPPWRPRLIGSLGVSVDRRNSGKCQPMDLIRRWPRQGPGEPA